MSKAEKDLPYGKKRSEEEKGRVDHVLGRKAGGRVKDDEGTNIHIEINAEKPQQGAVDEGPPVAGPVPPPPMVPPMIHPPGPGGPMGGGGPLGMKTGGGVHQAKESSMDAGAGSGVGRLEKIGKRP